MLGLRVAISVALVFLITSIFNYERSYWAVITIISVNISVNFGDILARSWIRLIASLLGLVFGTVIYYFFLLHVNINVIYLLLTLSAGVGLYFMFVSYSLAMFFNSLFVVFIFAAFSSWSEHLLVVRLYETLLGSTVSVVIAYILATKSSTKTILTQIEELHAQTKEFLDKFETKFEDRFVEFQHIHQTQKTVLMAMANSKYDYTNKRFYLKSKEVLLLIDELIFEFERWFELWYKLSHESKNSTMQQMYANVNFLLEHNLAHIDSPLSKSYSVHEKVITLYYNSLVEKVTLLDEKMLELKEVKL